MPLETSYGVYETKQYYKIENVSMGVSHTAEFNGMSIEFAEEMIELYKQFDARNLVFCQYLNIRNSEFTEIDA